MHLNLLLFSYLFYTYAASKFIVYPSMNSLKNNLRYNLNIVRAHDSSRWIKIFLTQVRNT